MKKAFFKIVTVCLFFLLLTAYSSNPADNKLGHVASNFSVENITGTKELQKMKGKYVLLTFWKSIDAESRIANIQYDRAIRDLKNIDYVAVNFDRSYGVYCEILKQDGLNEEMQYYGNDGDYSRLFSRYELKQGMKSLLIDKSGVIIAENPSPQELSKFIY